jgi:uncharacterized protein
MLAPNQRASLAQTMKKLVEAIAKALVDHPDDVQVRAVEGASTTIFELRVHPDDLGKVIGHHGRLADAIRVILAAAGTRVNRRVSLEILE